MRPDCLSAGIDIPCAGVKDPTTETELLLRYILQKHFNGESEKYHFFIGKSILPRAVFNIADKAGTINRIID